MISPNVKTNVSETLFNLDITTLKTGDLVFFSGNSAFSRLIQLATNSHWSHVGMIIRYKDEISYIESDKEYVESLQLKPGVRTYPFLEVIRHFQGDIALRSLLNTENEQLGIDTTIKEFTKNLDGLPYEKSILELFRAAYHGPFGNNVDDLSSIFCSELIAAAYQHAGLLPRAPLGLAANEYTPADFTAQDLKLLKGSLSNIIPLKSAVKPKLMEKVDLIPS